MSRVRFASLVLAGVSLVGLGSAARGAEAARFTPLSPISAKIAGASEAYPGGAHNVGNLVDGNPRTEYSSASKGTDTFVEFDFGQVVRVAAMRHLDRNDPATVSKSELILLDADGKAVATVPVTHANQRAGVTFHVLPEPVAARRARWHITGLGPQKFGTVGGAEIAFYQAGADEPAPRNLKVQAAASSLIERKGESLVQPLRLTVDYPYAQAVDVTLRVEGAEPQAVRLKPGAQSFEIGRPALDRETPVAVAVDGLGQTLASQSVSVKPARKLEIHLLPHSHVDIGYTALQADVVKKQNENTDIALRLIDATKNYPEGSRFKWNVEVLWPVENYLRDAAPAKRDAFIAAVKSGSIGLDAFHNNILTGLCRPEELVRLMSYAKTLSARWGVPVESAMISDVPGYTWSTVSAMSQAGVKYFSFAPNYFDRMGGTMVTWQDKPFWWKGPDGASRVLCWCPSRGYALGHLIGDGEALARFMPTYLEELAAKQYPYDLTYLRWNVHGDNGSPDEKVADVVRAWNARYAWPKLTINTTAKTFREFERRYGSQLPEYAGDYTPYWEDGAGSSSAETALNRASAERLAQAETIWTMRRPAAFPAADFYAAWRNVLLYSEHTWGAHNSVSQPDLAFVKDQWKVKQGFALDADRQSKALLATAMGGGGSLAGGVDVYNTNSWPRTELVVLPAALSSAGDRVMDGSGAAVPSQRLASGELAFVARDVPALAAARFRVVAGAAIAQGQVKAEGRTLSHPEFTVTIDESTGAIASLRSRRLNVELVDAKAGTAINDYFYLPGSNVKDVKRNGATKITVVDPGPLVATLRVESEAPGCRKLIRELRVVDGLDRIELANTVDKLPIRQKEGVHFGFGFNVPEGTVRMDVGWAVVRPEVDQIPAACKNWFSVQRWLDVSNGQYGVTLAPVDAPLVQLGGMTANLVGSQTNPKAWIAKLDPTQTIYSWAMNNHWHTNYRADQEGPVVFRYVLRPHAGFDALAAARFGVSCSQPLIPAAAVGDAPAAAPLRVEGDGVLVTALKPADEGAGWIVRLYGASGKAQQATIRSAKAGETRMWLSDTGERAGQPVAGPVTVPAWGIVTVRVE